MARPRPAELRVVADNGGAQPAAPAQIVVPPRRGLSRLEAAAYVGVGATKFDEMVADGRMPPAKRIDGRRVWDLRALDSAFDALPDEADARTAGANPWDSDGL